jgi:signal transduction histidine kinase
VTSAYVVLVPAYTVAAYEDRRHAVYGLALVVCGAVIFDYRSAGDLSGAAFAVIAAWGAGRAIRGHRMLTARLKRVASRLAAEREDRARLAVAGERTRIAHELHVVVAHNVAAMVVQAEAARSQLGNQPAAADTAMGAIEQTGRDSLTEMRRILGVLRHSHDRGERSPRPGVEQLYALIRSARDHGQQVELSVNGQPGTLPAGVDLGIYRIVEDALTAARCQPAAVVVVALRFGHEHLELQLTALCPGPSGWPTEAIRERVALYGGELLTDTPDRDGWQLVARLPRGPQGAPA